jgi:phage baseplate assembly protein W
MSNKIYNVKKVESIKASTGDDRISGGIAYKGFSSRAISQRFKVYDLDLVKQDILNNFNIKRGEKFENPEYGTIIWSMIYEPMDDGNIRMIEDDVIRILRADPRIEVKSVAVVPNEQGVRIEVDLRYLEFDITEQMFVTFNRSGTPGL